MRTLRRAIDGVVGAVVLILLGWWLVPERDDQMVAPSSASFATMSPTQNSTESFPVAAFDRTLWYVPPVPVVVTPPRPPEMPRLELIGILREGEGYRAMIVDPTTNEIRGVTDGDALGVTRVIAVTETLVRCEAHGIPFELSLEAPSP